MPVPMHMDTTPYALKQTTRATKEKEQDSSGLHHPRKKIKIKNTINLSFLLLSCFTRRAPENSGSKRSMQWRKLNPKGVTSAKGWRKLNPNWLPWAWGSCTPSRCEANADAQHSPLPSALQFIEQSDDLPSPSAAQGVAQCYGSSQGVHLLHGNAQLFNTVHSLQRHREWVHEHALSFVLSSPRSEAWLQLDNHSQGNRVELIQGTEKWAKTAHFISNWAHTRSNRQPDKKSLVKQMLQVGMRAQ